MTNPAIVNPNPSPQSTTSPGNPPAAAGPLTMFYGLRLIYPLQKQYVNGALKRVTEKILFNNGVTLADSTVYKGWIALPRNCTLTGLWLIMGVVPTAGVNALKVLLGSSGGATLLSGATFNPVGMAANTLVPVPLSAAVPTPLYLFNTPPVLPPALYCEYDSGVQGTAAQNVGLFAEFEMDDF